VYAYIYNETAETVGAESALSFDANGAMTSGIAHTPGSTDITIAAAGDYEVTYSASVTGVNQIALFVNGAAIAGTVYGAGAGTEQNTGHAIVAVGAGATLTVRNHTTAGAFALATPIGGTQPTVNASVTIEKLG
jgi:hypothetical protein